MTTKTIHRSLLILSLVLCSFIFIDSYELPIRISTEIIRNHWESSEGSIGLNYFINTDKQQYSLPFRLYDELRTGDTVYILRSKFSNVNEKMGFRLGTRVLGADINMLKTTGAIYLLLLVAIGIIFFLIFYNSLKNIKGRRNLTFLLLVLSVWLFYIYFKS